MSLSAKFLQVISEAREAIAELENQASKLDYASSTLSEWVDEDLFNECVEQIDTDSPSESYFKIVNLLEEASGESLTDEQKTEIRNFVGLEVDPTENNDQID